MFEIFDYCDFVIINIGEFKIGASVQASKTNHEKARRM